MLGLTEKQNVFTTEATHLYEYRRGVRGALIIIPPQAGHDWRIADYNTNRSLVQRAIDSAPEDMGIYIINFLPCSHERRNETYGDMVNQVYANVIEAATLSGTEIHLVGLCQGGALATVVTALHREDLGITELTIAGAPIDTRAAESDLEEAIKTPMSTYETMVAWGMTAGKRGRMAGKDMLFLWKSGDPWSHYITRYQKMFFGDTSGEHFYKWYDNTQDIAGPAYLFMIREFFKNNSLVKGEMVVNGILVDLSNIKDIRLNIVTGSEDTISPPKHTTELVKYITTTDVHFYTVIGGHLKVFNGAKGLKTTWHCLFSHRNAL